MADRIIIIGGGASGLIAAITAARKGASVTIIEKREQAGKKLLATGNGRCNLLNEDQGRDHFHSSDTVRMLEVLEKVSFESLLSFFQGIGIAVKSKNGYLYPVSGQASSVVKILYGTALSLGVKFIYNEEIVKIVRSEKGYALYSDSNKYMCEKVIIATGNIAGLKAGEKAGDDILAGLKFKQQLRVPALAALKSDARICRYWTGIRCDAGIKLMIEEKSVFSDKGELMLTDYGVSGIPAFQSCYRAAFALKNKQKVFMIIDFLSDFKNADILKILKESSKNRVNAFIPELFYGLLPMKLADSLVLDFFKSDAQLNNRISSKTKLSELNDDQINGLIDYIKNFKIKIIDTNSFDQAQVAAGGISLNEIDTDSCMSNKYKGLYLTGEILDVNGDCGGYNLQWAWTTGILAGQHAGAQE